MFRPDGFAARLEEISLDELAQQGVRGIIIDLDNTLIGYNESVLAPAVVSWILTARRRGFRIALVSNNFAQRVAAVGAHLEVPTVPSALKPLPRGFLRALALIGTQKHETVVVGDQLLTDVLGAKFAGLRAILTEPLTEHGFITTRVMRVIERFLLGNRR